MSGARCVDIAGALGGGSVAVHCAVRGDGNRLAAGGQCCDGVAAAGPELECDRRHLHTQGRPLSVAEKSVQHDTQAEERVQCPAPQFAEDSAGLGDQGNGLAAVVLSKPDLSAQNPAELDGLGNALPAGTGQGSGENDQVASLGDCQRGGHRCQQRTGRMRQ